MTLYPLQLPYFEAEAGWRWGERIDEEGFRNEPRRREEGLGRRVEAVDENPVEWVEQILRLERARSLLLG